MLSNERDAFFALVIVTFWQSAENRTSSWHSPTAPRHPSYEELPAGEGVGVGGEGGGAQSAVAYLEWDPPTTQAHPRHGPICILIDGCIDDSQRLALG